MIIKCPECCKDVSEKAGMCPYCGFPVRRTTKITAFKKQISSFKVTFVQKAPVICCLTGKTIAKCVAIAIPCIGIGAIKASMGSTPSIFNASAYNSYAITHNVLSSILWLIILGGTRLFFGNTTRRIMYYVFLFFGAIPILIGSLSLILSGDLNADLLVAHAVFVFIPWLFLVCSYTPKNTIKRRT